MLKMTFIPKLLVAFLYYGLVFGEEARKNETSCPPTIVDCACTDKDGKFYTIQINTTTVYVSDGDIGMDRCFADGDPLALCENRSCVIIPNDNFATLFRKGRKMSPSNYLQAEDLKTENETSSSISNKTDEKTGSELWDDLTAPFYPIELTYPRMIHGEEAHLLVKRSGSDDSDSYLPPPKNGFGGEKKENERKGQGQFKPPSDPQFGDEKYGKEQGDEPETDVSFESDRKSSELDNPQSEEKPSYRSQYANAGHNSYSDNTYWGGNYGYQCKVPQLRNSEVTCWKWPNWQTCKQKCIYGHGIGSSQGTLRSTTFTCRNSENNWRPHKMSDCQPYMNCKVRLRSPGDLKCVEPTNQAPYCDIACEQYDNQAAQRVRVTCDEKLGGMRLPFCATLDSGSSQG